MEEEKQEFDDISVSQQPQKDVLFMATIPIGLLMNHVMGTLTCYAKLPLYLDIMGTLLMAILIGIRAAISTNILTCFWGGLLINPAIPTHAIAFIAVAIVGGWMASKGFFRTYPRAIVTGLLMGMVGGICNTPVALLMDGFTGTCNDVTTGLLLLSGQSLFTSVFWSNFVNDPFDKIIQCLVVVWLIRAFPKRLRENFADSGYLMKNVKK